MFAADPAVRGAVCFGAIAAAFAAGASRADSPELRSNPEVFMPVQAAEKRLADTPPAVGSPGVVSRRIELPALAPGELEPLERNNAARHGGRALQVGVGRSPSDFDGVPEAPPIWEVLPDGSRATRIGIVSSGASSIRVGLSFRSAPPGMQLWFYGKTTDTALMAPASAAELIHLPEYWSPVISGDSITLEIRIPGNAGTGDPDFAVWKISHLIYEPTTNQWQKTGAETKLSTCETDVICTRPNAAVRAAASSVARMLFTKSDGTYLCSGTLLADMDASTQIPHFMTANHCISDQTVARTLNTYWFYESSVCGNDTAPNMRQLVAGASLLVTDSATDTTLLRLNENPPAGVTLSGFDANPVAPAIAAIGLHHPKGELKKLSSGTVVGFTPFNGEGSFLDVAWSNGVTESGSSGSGLFTQGDSAYYVRGTLKGGLSSCTNPAGHDSYSRLDLAWPALQPYLGTGASKTRVVEYYHAGFGHYFVTASAAEMAALDSGQIPGWSRTEQAFYAYSAPANGAAETCRFFSTSFSPKSSHFYTPHAAECALVKNNPNWLYEGVAFYTDLPSSTGTCSGGATALYRLYNNGRGGAPNHRYTISPTIRWQMIAQGWIPEGWGTLGVAACVVG